MKPNPKHVLVDVRNSADSAQLSSAIDKGYRILVILLSEGKI